jgi:enediyne biosynthesis protein E4
VQVQDGSGNRFAIGARIGVERAGRPTLWRRIRTDGSYLSAADVRAHFGLGPSASIDAIVVEWPDGRHERWTGISGDRRLTLRRGSGRAPGI